MSVERRRAAIFSADAKGFSRLMGEDELGTVRTLIAYRAMMREVIAQHHGRLEFRIGVNVGDVMVEGDHIYGAKVINASPLLLEPGQLAASEVAGILGDLGGRRSRHGRRCPSPSVRTDLGCAEGQGTPSRLGRHVPRPQVHCTRALESREGDLRAAAAPTRASGLGLGCALSTDYRRTR
jgi:hypothetical protein